MTAEQEQQLKRIEAALHVEVVGDRTTLLVTARNHQTQTFFVRMPTAIWREFCQHQIDAIPPQPATGGPS